MIFSIYCHVEDRLKPPFPDVWSLPAHNAILLGADVLIHWYETDFQAIKGQQSALWVSLSMAQIEDAALLEAIVSAGVSTIVLRGACGLADIEKASVLLTVAECRGEKIVGSCRVVAAVSDSARAVIVLPREASDIPRLSGFLFDGEALAKDLGLSASNGRTTPSLITTARDLTVIAARSCGVPIYGTVRHGDHDAAVAELSALRNNGFGGAITTDIALLPVIQSMFGDQS